MKKPIYIFQAEGSNWFIYYDDSPSIEKPFQVFQDNSIRAAKTSLSEALFFTLVAIGPGCYSLRMRLSKYKGLQE